MIGPYQTLQKKKLHKAMSSGLIWSIMSHSIRNSTVYGVTCVVPTGLQLCRSSIQHGDNGSSTAIMAATAVQVIHPQSSGLQQCHIHEKPSKAQQAHNMNEHKNHSESVHIKTVMAQSMDTNAQVDMFSTTR